MICITMLNVFVYYVERFALLLNIWTVQWNFLMENIPQQIALEISHPYKSLQGILLHKKIPSVKIPPVKTALQQI